MQLKTVKDRAFSYDYLRPQDLYGDPQRAGARFEARRRNGPGDWRCPDILPIERSYFRLAGISGPADLLIGRANGDLVRDIPFDQGGMVGRYRLGADIYRRKG